MALQIFYTQQYQDVGNNHEDGAINEVHLLRAYYAPGILYSFSQSSKHK